MNNLADMIWIEYKKAWRSRMVLWTTLGTLFMPLGMAFLIILAKNPQVMNRLGLVSAKANLVAYAATDWTSYLVLFAEIISAGGFFFFIIAVSWVFGREFTDGTVKDLLAVPVPRASIILAKFIIAAIWSAAMAIVMLVFGMLSGLLLHLPGGSAAAILHGALVSGVTSALAIAVVLPYAFFASAGRGYILPMALAVLTLIAANLLMALGLAEYFPWAVPLLYAQGQIAIRPISYTILAVICLGGMLVTYLWWNLTDQNR